jgi:predicted nucleic acid-binding protein
LKLVTKDLDGIALRCRRDYTVNAKWPKWGFVPKGSVRGRGADHAELVIWYYGHGHADLFSIAPPNKTIVALDTNVFLDLELPDRPHHDTSRVLLEPWIDEIVELSLTPEVFNDIYRAERPDVRERSRAAATGYHEINVPAGEMEKLLPSLQNLYPRATLLNDRDESDILHVAYTIAAGGRFFITRDDILLEKAPEVLAMHDLRILTPVQLIEHLDVIERQQEYEPARLEGTALSAERLTTADIEEAITSFRLHPVEKIVAFKDRLVASLSDPRTRFVFVARDSSKNMSALIACSQVGTATVITLLRISSSPLGPTLLRHLLMRVIHDAVKTGSTTIRVDDPDLPPAVQPAVSELGFIKAESGWIKPALRGFIETATLAGELQSIGVHHTWTADSSPDEIETVIWPAKLVHEGITAYLIPIQAQWAEHFFDNELALQRLPGMGVREELHLGVEAVYYTAAKLPITAPGRILWYVSQGQEKLGAMKVKATSRLREVIRGTPKELFRKFRRLGVYEWPQVIEAAGGDVASELTALRFSHTERFVNYPDRKYLTGLDLREPYMSPRQITSAQFQEIYNFASAPSKP